MVSATTPASRSRSRAHAGSCVEAGERGDCAGTRRLGLRACLSRRSIWQNAPRRQLIQAHGNGLAQIHGGLARIGGNLHERVAKSEIFAGEPALLWPEDQRHAAATGKFGADKRRQLRERNHGLLGLAVRAGSRANHQRAIGHGLGKALHVLRAFWSRSEAPTADFASRQCSSYGATTARRAKPKLAMARAAAPILRGLRGETRTTSSASRWGSVSKDPF